MILTHGANSLSLGGHLPKVVIGEHEYEYILIGSLLWTCQNLDYKYADNIIGTKAVYYNNDETTNGWNGTKYGLLYNQNAVRDLASYLPNRWRVPTLSDFNSLISTIGGNNSAKKLKSTSGWSNDGNGTDDYGFHALPAGTYFSNAFHDAGILTTYKSQTATWDGLYNVLELDDTNNIHTNKTSGTDMYSIRLCCDV